MLLNCFKLTPVPSSASATVKPMVWARRTMRNSGWRFTAGAGGVGPPT